VASDSNPDMQSPIGKIPRILESPQKIAKRQLETSLTQSSWQQRYLHLIQKQQALSHHHHQNSHYFTVPEYDSIRMQLSLSRFHLMTQHAARDSDGSMLSNCNTYACLTPGCVLQPLNKCPANILNDANGERIPSSGLFTVPFVPRREHSLQLTNASGDVSSVQSIILDDEKGAYSNVFSVLVDGSSFSVVYEKREGRLVCRRCKTRKGQRCPHVLAVVNGWYSGILGFEDESESQSSTSDSESSIEQDQSDMRLLWKDRAAVSCLKVPTLYEALNDKAEPVSNHSILIDRQVAVLSDHGASAVNKSPLHFNHSSGLNAANSAKGPSGSGVALSALRPFCDGLPLFRPLVCSRPSCNRILNFDTPLKRYSISATRRYSILFTLTESIRVIVETVQCPSCEKVNHYDGVHDRIFNYDNVFLFSHDLLDDYTSFMKSSSMTFNAYWNVHKDKRKRFGMDRFADRKKFVSAWHAYKDIQSWEYKFSCDKCGPVPKQVVLDGVTLASPIDPRWWQPFESERKTASHFPLANLLYISDRPLAKLLYNQNGKLFPRDNWKPSKNSISAEEIGVLGAELKAKHPVLAEFVMFTKRLPKDSAAQQLCRRIIRVLSTSEPLTHFVPIREAEKLKQFFENELPFANVDLTKMPLLHKLAHEFNLAARIEDIPLRTAVGKQNERNSNVNNVAPIWALMSDLAERVVNMNKEIEEWSRTYRSEENRIERKEELFHSWFGMKQVRIAGKYSLDHARGKNRLSGIENDDICEKNAASSKDMSWGVMGIWCPHQICHGFHLIPSAEGPRDAFLPLFERFETAPEIVVYDNACSLAKYALAREPEFFKHTKFLVDRLHGKNHSACSEACLLKSSLDVQAANVDWHDSTAESGNKMLNRIRTSCKMMSVRRVRNYIRLMLECMNQQRANSEEYQSMDPIANPDTRTHTYTSISTTAEAIARQVLHAYAYEHAQLQQDISNHENN
jgi:hypothetical protein